MDKYRVERKGIRTIKIKLCEKCGKDLDRINNITSKYCLDCSKEIKREKTRERVRKYREKLKNEVILSKT